MTERRPLPYAWDDVRARLQRDIDGLLDRLFPAVRAAGGSAPLTPLNPTRADRRPGSFVIWRDGERKGAWKDYATGEQGDVFDLIAYVERLAGKMDVYWWALDHLGLERHAFRTKAQDQQERERRERDRLAAAARASEAEEEKAGRLLKQWLALAPVTGTLAEAYLREGRRIPLERLPRAPDALRFHPALDHICDDTGEVTTWPCMVAAMTRGRKLTALHRTWLMPDGSGKAAVAKPKKMIGSARGACIRLARGASGLSPSEAARRALRDPLMVGEGIETTLTCAVAQPGYRAWAAGSLDNMGRFDWPDCASAMVLLRDNDWGEQARAAFEAVERHWRGQADGRPVKVVASRVGSDFNDAVRAG